MMKKLVWLAFFVSCLAYGQDDWQIDCGTLLSKDSIVTVNNIYADCAKTLLMQDNSVITIRGDVVGSALRLVYGDSFDDPTQAREELPQVDQDGFEYMDYRTVGSANPKIIFEKCMPPDTYVGPYIDAEYPRLCEDLTLGDEENLPNELVYQCTIWNMLGQVMYEGPFSGIFNGDCGVECLKDNFWNRMLLIEFDTQEYGKVRVKRIYVR